MSKPLSFAFGAFNTNRETSQTVLSVQLLDPGDFEHCAKLREIAEEPATRRFLASRRLRFAKPSADARMTVAFGRERAIVDLDEPAPECCKSPVMRHLGELSADAVATLVDPQREQLKGASAREIALNLLPGEMQQTIISLEMQGEADEVQAVHVSHHAILKEGKSRVPIGDLTVLFVRPHDPLTNCAQKPKGKG